MIAAYLSGIAATARLVGVCLANLPTCLWFPPERSTTYALHWYPLPNRPMSAPIATPSMCRISPAQPRLCAVRSRPDGEGVSEGPVRGSDWERGSCALPLGGRYRRALGGYDFSRNHTLCETGTSPRVAGGGYGGGRAGIRHLGAARCFAVYPRERGRYCFHSSNPKMLCGLSPRAGEILHRQGIIPRRRADVNARSLMGCTSDF